MVLKKGKEIRANVDSIKHKYCKNRKLPFSNTSIMNSSGLFNKNPYAGQFSSHKRSGYKTIAEKRKKLEKRVVKDTSKYSSNTIHKYNKSYCHSNGMKNSSQISSKDKYSRVPKTQKLRQTSVSI